GRRAARRAVAAAAREALARIDATPPPSGDAAWQATCRRLRAGEQAVARAILELVELGDPP
ncbi:MAG TPA: hypothetical protein VHE35_28955, partial [Kofleriaceae bacterium]|nr:hypothetical protein [Kofleriaceae bacterium]